MRLLLQAVEPGHFIQKAPAFQWHRRSITPNRLQKQQLSIISRIENHMGRLILTCLLLTDHDRMINHRIRPISRVSQRDHRHVAETRVYQKAVG